MKRKQRKFFNDNYEPHQNIHAFSAKIALHTSFWDEQNAKMLVNVTDIAAEITY